MLPVFTAASVPLYKRCPFFFFSPLRNFRVTFIVTVFCNYYIHYRLIKYWRTYTTTTKYVFISSWISSFHNSKFLLIRRQHYVWKIDNNFSRKQVVISQDIVLKLKERDCIFIVLKKTYGEQTEGGRSSEAPCDLPSIFPEQSSISKLSSAKNLLLRPSVITMLLPLRLPPILYLRPTKVLPRPGGKRDIYNFTINYNNDTKS